MSEKPKRKRSPRRVYLIVGTLLISVIAILILLGWSVEPKPSTQAYLSSAFASPFYLQGTGEARYRGFEASAAIDDLIDDLPASAKNFAYYEVRWQDMVAWMRFDLPPDDFPNWLATAERVCAELVDQKMPSFNAPFRTNWWHPETATRYAGAECGEYPEYYRILVNMTRSDAWTVYLQIDLL